MDLSIFFAQFWGVYMLFFGVAMIARPKLIRDVVNGLEGNRGLSFFMGAFIFMLGTVLVLLHNVWESSWRVLITLFGWAALLKGAVYILAPEFMLKWVRFVANKDIFKYVATALVVIIGLYLSYIGFGFSI